MQNREIADIFERMADILEFKGGNPFKVNAYRKAARAIGDLTEDIAALAEEGRLWEISGIGEGIARKIQEYIREGRITTYEELRRGIPEGLIDLLGVQGLGPKTLSLLHRKVKVVDGKSLKTALRGDGVLRLPGMGRKKAQNILRALEIYVEGRERVPLGDALPVADAIVEALKAKAPVTEAVPAGSLRRMKETVGDIDILATGRPAAGILSTFGALPPVKRVLLSGETKASVLVEGNFQVDLRVVERGCFGAALQYFTGSKAHNVRLRKIARARGLKINEYGIFRGRRRICGGREKEIYERLNLAYIPPELREDRGEIEAAAEGRLPRLVAMKSIRGDLHAHTRWSDGRDSIEAMASAAKDMGYSYLAVTDHSPFLKIAGGLSERRLREQGERILALQRRLKGFRLLRGVETDIRSDGSLDLPDDLLKEMDIVIAAVHSGFRQTKEKMTKRVTRALRNPHVDILAHPSGRLLGFREATALDLGETIRVAGETGTALEINAHPERLDLTDHWSRRAGEAGVMISIGTDAHSREGLRLMRFGVGVARRGWLEGRQVLNTRKGETLLKWLRAGKGNR